MEKLKVVLVIMFLCSFFCLLLSIYSLQYYDIMGLHEFLFVIVAFILGFLGIVFSVNQFKKIICNGREIRAHW